jgi:CRP-like cAMP-binding protein
LILSLFFKKEARNVKMKSSTHKKIIVLMPIKITELCTIPIFDALCEESRLTLAKRAFLMTFHSGQILITEGSKTEFCYFVSSGALRALRIGRDGRVQLLSRLSVGEPVNVVSLLLDEKINRSTIEVLSGKERL